MIVTYDQENHRRISFESLDIGEFFLLEDDIDPRQKISATDYLLYHGGGDGRVSRFSAGVICPKYKIIRVFKHLHLT